MDAQQKQQIADKLTQSNNILVTVSTNPSVDQLAACIGLTLALNKMGKHAAAVFSGVVPNTLEFLQPEKTIEKTTDSLRDFIVSLDKSKADKLRYKVEDKVVKIFITPYKTSITDKDLEFSQGDFNVDIVVALGVHVQTDIDQAITAHGRILHDATVAAINIKPGGEPGTINWLQPAASSLCELVVQLLDATKQKVMDGQMATALLTGIVAETQRFSNSKTSAQTMTISAELMAAGANPQLVATKLEEPKEEPKAEPALVVAPAEAEPTPENKPRQAGPLAEASPTARPEQAKPSEGTLEIEHIDLDKAPDIDVTQPPEPVTPQIDIDHEGTLRRLEELRASQAAPMPAPSETSGRKILQPLGSAQASPGNTLVSPMTAADGLSLPQPGQADFERPSGAPSPPPSQASALPFDAGLAAPASPSPAVPPAAPEPTHLDSARDAVQSAHQTSGAPPLEPITALNAMPLHLPLRDDQSAQPAADGAPAGLSLPSIGSPVDASAPPPVPPPMLPPPAQ
ncbi:MAG: DHH family phosphoesterase [Candidatus Saccharimonadales bacterium]